MSGTKIANISSARYTYIKVEFKMKVEKRIQNSKLMVQHKIIYFFIQFSEPNRIGIRIGDHISMQFTERNRFPINNLIVVQFWKIVRNANENMIQFMLRQFVIQRFLIYETEDFC